MSMRESVMEAARRVDVVDEPQRPKAVAIDHAQLEREIAMDNNAFDDAHWVVQRAIARGQRDASHPRPADSAALRSVRDILLGVQAEQ